jgi:hypothetical protein
MGKWIATRVYISKYVIASCSLFIGLSQKTELKYII